MTFYIEDNGESKILTEDKTSIIYEIEKTGLNYYRLYTLEKYRERFNHQYTKEG